MHLLAKYGVAFSFEAPIPKVDDTDFAATGDWTPATGDVKVSKDGGNVANIATLPVAVGGAGSVLWTWALSATEMQAARITIQVVDAAVENQAFVVQTYGNASAQHAADFDDAVRLGLTALPAAAADAAGGLIISDAGGLDADAQAASVTAIETDTSTTLDNLVDDLESRLGTPSDLGSGATVAANLVDMAGATFSSATDSLEAIRNRGDAEWTTGAGGTPPELLQATTIATLASQTSFTLTDGSADDDAYKDCTAVITDVATATQKCFGHIAGYVGSTKTVTLTVDPGVFTIATTDNIDIIAPSVTHALSAAAAAFAAINTHIDLFTTDSGQLLATAEPGSFAEQVSTLIGTPADTDIATDIANVQTEADKLGTPAGASVSADIAAVKSDSAAILLDTAEIGAAGAGLTEAGGTGGQYTAIPWNAAWDAEVQSEAADALNAYDAPTKAELDAGLAALNNISAAEVNAEMVDVLAVDANAVPTAVPAANAPIAEQVAWVATLARNKITQTATTQALRNDADSGNIATAAVSDDGTTAVRAEWA
jgi:hypothetical protein